jgi:hypothetical protein
MRANSDSTDRCDAHCIAYVAAHEASDIFVETDTGYTAEIAFDFVEFCDADGKPVKLSRKTWKDIRNRVIEAQRSAYVSGFFHGWERLDYEQATLDWLDGDDP